MTQSIVFVTSFMDSGDTVREVVPPGFELAVVAANSPDYDASITEFNEQCRGGHSSASGSSAVASVPTPPDSPFSTGTPGTVPVFIEEFAFFNRNRSPFCSGCESS